MRAIRIHRFGEPEVLQLDELPTPRPGPGQVLVRVEAAGVNFLDTHHRSGTGTGPHFKSTLPFIPGFEGAGVVEELGPGVTDVAVGDRVAWESVMGSYASHLLVPAEKLVPLPDGISTRQAAAAMSQGLTAHYLTHSSYPVRPGDVCLVHAAAGGVGLLLCQAIKLRGGRVIGTTSSAAKAALARQAGADEVILYTEQDFQAEVMRLTDAKGVQVVYDSVGKDTFDKGLDCLAPLGYMVLYGEPSGSVPPLDPQVLNAKGSLFLHRPTLQHFILTREALLERAAAVFGWIASGRMILRIERTYPLADAAQAHRDLESRRTSGKLLLIP